MFFFHAFFICNVFITSISASGSGRSGHNRDNIYRNQDTFQNSRPSFAQSKPTETEMGLHVKVTGSREPDDKGNGKELRPISNVNIDSPRLSRPINYQFSKKEDDINDRSEFRNGNEEGAHKDERVEGKTSQVRGYRLLSKYKSTTGGSLAITSSSTSVGVSMGYFLAKSSHILPPRSTSIALGSTFFVLSLAKFKPPDDGNPNKSPTNPFSLLIQTLGLTLILLLQRTRDIRKQLPTKPHLANIIRPNSYPRSPFPPANEDNDNPWKYEIQAQDSIYMENYNMIKILLSMAFVGAVCGGNLPLIPTWFGGLIGAGLFCFVSTLRNSKGDLGRTIAMKVVSLITELFFLNEELGILNKSGVVLNIIFDKLLILDRKHSIRDKITLALKWFYGQIMGIVNKVRADVAGADSDYEEESSRLESDRDRRREREVRGTGRDRDRYRDGGIDRAEEINRENNIIGNKERSMDRTYKDLDDQNKGRRGTNANSPPNFRSQSR